MSSPIIEPGSYRELATIEAAVGVVAASIVAFDLTAPVSEAEMPPRLAEEPMVVISARVPTSTYLRIREADTVRGVAPSTIIREWLELQRAASEPDRPVRLADVLRAVAQLPSAAA